MKFFTIITLLLACNTVSGAITARKIADSRTNNDPRLQRNEYGFYEFVQDIDIVNTNWIALSNSPTEVSLEIDDYAELMVINSKPAGELHRLNMSDGNQSVIYGRYNGEVGDWEIFKESDSYVFHLSVWRGEGTGHHEELWLLMDESLNGDLNSDGVLNVNDINLFTIDDPSMDMNRDGSVNEGDRSYWVQTIMGTNYGDANLDGSFNTTDFVTIFQGGLYETPAAAGWETGDFSGDALFDSSDLTLALSLGAYEEGGAAAHAVPEPTASILIFLCVCLWRKR